MPPPEPRTSSIDGAVREIDFTLTVGSSRVPCVVWMPNGSAAPRTLVAFGHGGAQHKKSPGIRARALRYASQHGWVGLAIDAPDHGERTTTERAELQRTLTERRIRGDHAVPSLAPAEKIAFLDDLATQAVPEWQAALDAVCTHIAPSLERFGYWGISHGTWIGIPLLAAEPRFSCAVLGLAQLHPEHARLREAAAQVSMPVRFTIQWDDPIRDREFGLALFSTLGSREKSLHVYPGGHAETPTEEATAWDLFFKRHLV